MPIAPEKVLFLTILRIFIYKKKSPPSFPKMSRHLNFKGSAENKNNLLWENKVGKIWDKGFWRTSFQCSIFLLPNPFCRLRFFAIFSRLFHTKILHCETYQTKRTKRTKRTKNKNNACKLITLLLE